MTTDRGPQAIAARRYTLINLLRFAAIGMIALGIAIARGVVEAPYPLGVALAVAGVATFFFGPYNLVKRWKARDRDDG